MSKSITSSYSEEDQYISIFVKGVVNFEVGVEIMKYANARMQEHACSRVYFDVADTLSSATTAENFEFAKAIPNLGFTPEFRWAVYYKNDAHMYEMISGMLKTANINNLYMVNDSEKAKNWLLAQEA